MIANLSISTWIFILLILAVFSWFVYQLYAQWQLNTTLRQACERGNPLDALKTGNLQPLSKTYMKTIAVETNEGLKSNIPSSTIFTDASTTKAFSINLRMLDAASGLMVGMGLFGTFWGLTEGISGFESSTSEDIQSSIQNLLGGMSTAFLTSLFGMGTSMLFTWWDKALKKSFYRQLDEMTEKLDELFYIDDVQLTQMRQQAMIYNLASQLRHELQEQIGMIGSSLEQKLTYTKESGEQVAVANAIREILTENTQQTTALKSFSTDLALELSQGFDEVLSKQMQKKILPLMENVDNTTKIIVEHIDHMAAQVAAPATDMIQSMVTELKEGMAAIVDEFKTGLSQSATGELENLSHQLGTAAQSMADFPKNMESMSATLQVTIEEVKTAISEISNTSATANSSAMQQMQEQIGFAMGAISNAISEVKEVMGTITQSSQEQSNQMVSKLADATEKMTSFLDATVSSLSSSVQQSIQSITEDVSDKQANLIALQEDTTTQTKKLLETFNTGLERLEQLNDNIAGTMNMFQQAQGQITGSTAHLQTISGDMKLATQLFGKSQADYTTKMEQLQQNTQRSIDDVTEMIDQTGELSADYVNQFEIIKAGLGSIFAELQSGLTEYSRTVQASTQKYLDQYSNSLTQTANALSSAIESQKEVVDMLNETLTQQKKS